MLAALLVAFSALSAASLNAVVTASEQHWREFSENIPGAVYICELSPPWRVSFMSRLVFEITGWTAEDFLADRVQWAALILPEDLPLVEAAIDRAVADHASYAVDYRILHRDGSERWVHEVGRPVLDAHGNPSHLEGNIFDITSNKLSEQALQASKNFGQAILDSLGTLMVVVDTNGRIIATNRA